MGLVQRVKRAGQRSYEQSERIYRRVTDIGAFLMRQLYRYRASGAENVPAAGPTLVVVNHLHLLDPFAVATAIRRQMITMVASKWVDNGIVAQILNWAGVIYVRRGEVDRRALRDALQVLADGKALAMAPEGTRSKSGVLQRAKGGVAYLAMRSDAVIVPVASWGIERLKDWGKLHRPDCTVVVGQPFRLPHLEGRATSKQLEELSDLVMMQIGRLLPRSYWGAYADEIEALESGHWTGLSVIPVTPAGAGG